MTSFLIKQIRYNDAFRAYVWDSYPVLFISLEDARKHYANGGEATHFEHVGGTVSISELDRRGVEMDEHEVAAGKEVAI